MNNLCSNKTWNEILNTNFSNFLDRLREELQDDLETFLYLSYRLYSFILDNRLSLHTTFVDFCFCKRTCDKKKSQKSVIVNFILEFFLNLLMNINILMI